MANPRPHRVEVAATCPPAETVDCSGRARMFLDTRTEFSPEGNQCYWLPKSLLELRLDLVEKSVTELDIFFFFISFILFKSFGFLSCHLTVTRFVTVGAQGCGWDWHFEKKIFFFFFLTQIRKEFWQIGILKKTSKATCLDQIKTPFFELVSSAQPWNARNGSPSQTVRIAAPNRRPDK